MLISSIRSILSTIRSDLQKVLIKQDEQSGIVYDIQPLVEAINKTVELIERNGIPRYIGRPVKITDDVKSDFFNHLTDNLHQILKVLTTILDELTDETNKVVEDYGEIINRINPQLEKLKASVDDVESQTLEKVTNTSIFDHEIKNIDFDKSVQDSDLTYTYNTLLLPIVSSTIIPTVDHSLSIIESPEARRRLDQPMVATEDKTDADVLVGTYFGNIIGTLDGSESYISEDEVDLSQLHDADFNTGLQANYYSNIPNDNFRIGVTTNLTPNTQVNFIRIDSNVEPELALRMDDGSQVKAQLKNNIWARLMNVTDVVVNLEQIKPERLKYQGIDIYRGDNIVKRHNFFNSLGYKFPTLLEELNNTIQTTAIELIPEHRVVEADRTGFFKYHIDINQIEIRNNVYGSSGSWTSELITTDYPIQAVEVLGDFSVPDDQLDYINVNISFDNIIWYPLRFKNEGITVFNNTKKARIVLTNENNNDDYMFIGEQKQNRGVHLRVDLRSNDTLKSPAIYNLKLRIKVNTNE